MDKGALWMPILEFRYGCLEGAIIGGVPIEAVKKSSFWWHDIVNILHEYASRIE